MATVRAKKRLMYITFSFIFLFGGIEYAVILPTLWLYLHNTYNPPEFMLGLVLSAYSLAAFISAPIFGRMSDKVHCTKKIFVICCLFQMVGSFLYFIGISQWLCVASRFISGLGAAGEAIAIAEVSRFTSEKERTGIISNLIATRQIALLLGPALNLFLRLADFKIGPFSVTKYSAPGAFMVVMWIVLMLVVLLLYSEPHEIYAQQETEAKQETGQASGGYGATGRTASPKRYAYSHSYDLLASDDGMETVYPPLSSEKLSGPYSQDGWDSSTEYHEIMPDGQMSSTLQDGCSPGYGVPYGAASNRGENIVSVNQRRDGSVNCDSPDIENTKSSGVKKDLHTQDPRLKNTLVSQTTTQRDSDAEASEEFYDVLTRSLPAGEVDLSSSVKVLATAERLIKQNQWSASQKDVLSYSGNTTQLRARLAEAVDGETRDDLFFHENHFSGCHSVRDRLASGSAADDRTPLLGPRGHTQNGYLQAQTGESDPYIERSLTAFDDPISREGRLGFCCNEYIRDEIVAILCLLFCAMFSQICVETMVLPLSLDYLDFGELENSLLYFVCGAEIIVVFLILTRLTKCISDRVLLLFGAAILLSSNIWLLYFLPLLPKHHRLHNIPFFSVAVVLDVLSLPFLIVCSTSLYSKLTRKQTQGLSQGLRRAIVSLGTIMAPMWGSSASTEPGLLLGVLVALQSLSMILCIFSFPRLKPPSDESNPSPSPPQDKPNGHGTTKTTEGYLNEEEEEDREGEESKRWSRGASINSHPVDQSHHQGAPSPHTEEFFDSHSPRDRSSSAATGFLTPYGSIARSSSFRSIQSSGSAAGSPQLWASPAV